MNNIHEEMTKRALERIAMSTKAFRAGHGAAKNRWRLDDSLVHWVQHRPENKGQRGGNRYDVDPLEIKEFLKGYEKYQEWNKK